MYQRIPAMARCCRACSRYAAKHSDAVRPGKCNAMESHDISSLASLCLALPGAGTLGRRRASAAAFRSVARSPEVHDVVTVLEWDATSRSGATGVLDESASWLGENTGHERRRTGRNARRRTRDKLRSRLIHCRVRTGEKMKLPARNSKVPSINSRSP